MDIIAQDKISVKPTEPETILATLNDLNELERRQEQAVRNILGPIMAALDDIKQIIAARGVTA